MHYDGDLATLEVSVRELAYADHPPGLVAGAFARLRTELGRVVHRRVQSECAAGETEVPLTLERVIDGVRCRVRGRADIVRRLETGTSCVVEEIKSVFDLGDDGDDEVRTHEPAEIQVKLYALALSDEGYEDIQATIVLVEIDADRRRSRPVTFERDAVETLLERALRVQIAAARAEAERARRRRESAAAIRFPFPSPRTGQQELIDQIEHALADDRPVVLSAPTGTGKTVVSLVPALREGLRRGAAIWFLTAKTSQRRLAAETFEAIVDASGLPLRAVVTRRKDDMCPPGHLRCHPALCPLLAEFHERASPVLDELRTHSVLQPDVLLERGRAATLCPYELMHACIEEADVVIGDHSHVYDPRRSRASSGPRLVVVDEAHNLVDRARAMSSVFVPRRLAALAKAPALGQPLLQLRDDVVATIDAALATAAEDEAVGHEGRTTTELDIDRWQQLGLESGLLALRYASVRLRRRDYEPRDPVLQVLEAIAFLGELAGQDDPALAGILAGPETPGGAGIGVLCLDPARLLARRHRDQEGVVVMSATLEPVDYFIDVLGLARLQPAVLRAGSQFPAENRCVSIVPSVRTTFDERDEHAPTIAAQIAEVIALEPGNYIAFFPSFRFLTTVSTHLDRAALADQGIALVVQPPQASEAIRGRILDRLGRSDRPTLLLAVTGGVFGEGIDLPGDALIGAIIIGPALPALSFERVLMQAHYHDRSSDGSGGFAYAMAYPGMQRVIQAAGRVHRTPEDRGVIVLLGARFCEPPYCDALPEHWYDYAPDELVVDELGPRLRRFWSS